MAITGDGAAAAILAALDASGAFDAIEDEDTRADVRAATLAGLEDHYGALVSYLVANVEVVIPQGQRVDNLSGTQIGETAEEQRGTIE